MGHIDRQAIRDALATEAGYVGLVASARRGATVAERLRDEGFDEASIARLRFPARLGLGPSSQEEIAVAELVAWRHSHDAVDAVVSAAAAQPAG